MISSSTNPLISKSFDLLSYLSQLEQPCEETFDAVFEEPAPTLEKVPSKNLEPTLQTRVPQEEAIQLDFPSTVSQPEISNTLHTKRFGKKPWTDEEYRILEELIQNNPTFNQKEIAQLAQSTLKRTLRAIIAHISSKEMITSHPTRASNKNWTKNEITALTQLINDNPTYNQKEIAQIAQYTSLNKPLSTIQTYISKNALIKPSSKTWTKDENAILIQLIKDNSTLKTKKIAQLAQHTLLDRTLDEIQRHIHNKLSAIPSPSKQLAQGTLQNKSVNTTKSQTKRVSTNTHQKVRRKWAEEETDILKKLIQNNPQLSALKIAQLAQDKLPLRTVSSTQSYILHNNSLKPLKTNTRVWTTEETDFLRKLIQENPTLRQQAIARLAHDKLQSRTIGSIGKYISSHILLITSQTQQKEKEDIIPENSTQASNTPPPTENAYHTLSPSPLKWIDV